MAIATAEAGEVTLAYEETGPDSPTGDPLILIAGGFMDMDHWQFQADALAGDRRVIRFDQRGHGLTGSALDGDYSREAFVADVDRVTVAVGLDRFVLVGDSMGGAMLLK